MLLADTTHVGEGLREINQVPEEEARQDHFCGNCGAEIRPGTAFCVSCGKRLVSETKPLEGTAAEPGSESLAG